MCARQSLDSAHGPSWSRNCRWWPSYCGGEPDTGWTEVVALAGAGLRGGPGHGSSRPGMRPRARKWSEAALTAWPLFSAVTEIFSQPSAASNRMTACTGRQDGQAGRGPGGPAWPRGIAGCRVHRVLSCLVRDRPEARRGGGTPGGPLFRRGSDTAGAVWGPSQDRIRSTTANGSQRQPCRSDPGWWRRPQVSPGAARELVLAPVRRLWRGRLLGIRAPDLPSNRPAGRGSARWTPVARAQPDPLVSLPPSRNDVTRSSGLPRMPRGRRSIEWQARGRGVTRSPRVGHRRRGDSQDVSIATARSPAAPAPQRRAGEPAR